MEPIVEFSKNVSGWSFSKKTEAQAWKQTGSFQNFSRNVDM